MRGITEELLDQREVVDHGNVLELGEEIDCFCVCGMECFFWFYSFCLINIQKSYASKIPIDFHF